MGVFNIAELIIFSSSQFCVPPRWQFFPQLCFTEGIISSDAEHNMRLDEWYSGRYRWRGMQLEGNTNRSKLFTSLSHCSRLCPIHTTHLTQLQHCQYVTEILKKNNTRAFLFTRISVICSSEAAGGRKSLKKSFFNTHCGYISVSLMSSVIPDSSITMY